MSQPSEHMPLSMREGAPHSGHRRVMRGPQKKSGGGAFFGRPFFRRRRLYTMSTTPEEHLDDDVITVPGQLYALVSFVGPDQRQKAEKFGMKLRGVFATREDADAFVRKIRRFDTVMDVFLIEMWKWVLIPPPANPLEMEHVDVQYDQKFLQDLIQGYRQNQQLAREHFEERKRLVIEEGLDKHLDPEERLPPPPADMVANPASFFEEEDPFLSARVRKAKEERERERELENA